MSPTQRERTEGTTAALIAAARGLFAADGYQATSLAAVVDAAGLTKGALYHHYAGKRELFAAVFAAEQERLGAVVAEAYVAADEDPWDAFEAACKAFVKTCQEPGTQRIFLLDAPLALGWETIRRLEAPSMAMMIAGIERAIAAGTLAPRPVEPLAHLLFGAICESAMVVARASDQSTALRESAAELSALLGGLRARDR